MKTFPDHVPDGHEARLTDHDRLAALSAVDIMDTEPEEAFDRLVRLATRVTGTPVGLVSMVDGKRQFFKAQLGLTGDVAEARETPLSHSFCQYVVSTDEPLAVTDARKHPLLAQNGAVPDLGVVAYLGIPVHGPSGEALGSFCAIHDQPKEWTEAEKEALADLAQMLENEIRLRHLLRERDLLLREMNHRVKNTFAIVQGIVRLSRREHATAQELATVIDSRITALAQAHEFIVPVVVAGKATSAPNVSLQKLIAMLLEPHIDSEAGHVTLDGTALMLGSQATTYLALVFHELATNAAKYGVFSESGGTLGVRWQVEGDHLLINWVETGVNARMEPTEHEGFGTRLIKISVEGQLRGSIERDFAPDGVRLALRIPMERLSL